MPSREFRGPSGDWDRFRRADSSTLGSPESRTARSWSEFGSGNLSISSQKVVSTVAQGTWGLARMSGGSLAIGVDHYCEGTFVMPGSGTAGGMVFLRKADNTPQTFYAGEISQTGGSTTLAITEWTAGSRAVLTSKAFGASGQTVHLVIEVEGSLLKLYTNSGGTETQQLSFTDTSIASDPTNTYPGFGLDGAAEATAIAFGQLRDVFTAPTGATYKTGSRTAFDQPWSSVSPFNRPIGSGATYANISTTGPLGNGANIVPGIKITLSIYQAAANDPWVPIYVRPGSDLTQSKLYDYAQAPATITTPIGGFHRAMVLVQPDGKWAIHLYSTSAYTGAEGAGWSAVGLRSGTRWTRVDQSGRYQYFVGNHEAGDTYANGPIRQGELNTGIFHCLTALQKESNLQGDYVWPANNASAGTYATSSNLRFGTLLAIPPSFDVTTLGDLQTRRIAKALQDYGVQIIDVGSTDQEIALETARDALDDYPTGYGAYNVIKDFNHPFWQDLQTAMRQLKVVTNNTPTSIGGGGTLRDTLPAPISSTPLPAAPTTLAAGTVTTSTVPLTWVAPAPQGDTLELEQERVTAPAVAWQVIQTLPGNQTSFTVTGLSAGIEFNFRIRAQNVQGYSGYSNILNVTTASTPAPPASPGNPTISALAYDQVRASWDNVTGETGFEVEISKNGGAYVLVASPAADVLSYDYTDPDPADGENVYQQQVRAMNANGPSEYAVSGTVTTPPRVAAGTGVSRISEKWSNFNAWGLYTSGAEATSKIALTRVAAPTALGYALSALKIDTTAALASAGELSRTITLEDLSEVHLWTEWLIPGGFAAPADPGVVWLTLLESSGGNRVCAVYLVDTDTLKVVIDTSGGAITYTLGTGVATNTRHQLRISARVGIGSFLQIWYDTVGVVDVTPTFSASLVTQLKVGASVPAGWTGTIYDGRLELNAERQFVTDLSTATEFSEVRISLPDAPAFPSPPHIFPP